MAKIDRFEDIAAWQKARKLTRLIYTVSNEAGFSHDFGLRDQIRRASISIMSNIAEGLERGTNKELIQFLYIAKGSAGEVRSHLYIALNLEYIEPKRFTALIALTLEISRIITGFISYLSNSGMKGAKR